MCIRIPDFPWGEHWVYTNFPRGEIWYIIDFPGGNSSMGVKLGCNTGNSFNELKVIVTCISTELCTCIYTTYDQNYKCTDH